MWRWGSRLALDMGRALRRPVWRRLGGLLALLWVFDRAVYFLTESQWQSAAGLGALWRVRTQTQSLLFVSAASAVLLLSLWPWRTLVALPALPPALPPRYGWLERRLRRLMRYDMRLVVLLISLGAVFTGWGAASHWADWLLWRHGGVWGVEALLWQRDAGFWVFQLPGWYLLRHIAARAVEIALLGGLILASGRGAAQFLSGRPPLPRGAARCLLLLAALFFALRAVRYFLAPFDETATLGYDFVAWHGRRPAFWLAAVLNAGAALLFLGATLNLARPRWLIGAGNIAWLAPSILLLTVPHFAALWGDEAPLRAARQGATRAAWHLDEITVRDWAPLSASRTAPLDAAWVNDLPLSPEKSQPTAPVTAYTIIELDSLGERLLWAWRLRNGRVLGQKTLAFPHDLRLWTAKLAPFFVPGGAAHYVEAEGRGFWIQELLAVSSAFPGAAPLNIENGSENNLAGFNYAADAVAMVTDSAGITKFYAAREKPDPLTQVWQRKLPDWILPYGALPAALRAQCRYSPLLLLAQAQQLGLYPARQVGKDNVLSKQAPVYARFPTAQGAGWQIALSENEFGDDLAALLHAENDVGGGVHLTLLRFNAATKPLDSGLSGPDVLDSRLRDNLPLDENQQESAKWVRGTVLPVAAAGRVWLWQALLKQPHGEVAAVAVADAAWTGGPVGVGPTPRRALEDWRHLSVNWDKSDEPDNDESLRARLSALLEPRRAHDAAQIAQLVEEAARLHQAAALAENSDRAAAARLRQAEQIILEKLRLQTAPHRPESGPK
jgi:hypothetical protein